MTIFLGYLAIGVVVLLLVFGAHLIESRNQTSSAARRPTSFKEAVLDKVIVPLLAGVLVILAWPVALYWQCKDKFFPAEETAAPKEFAVTSADLVQAWTIPEIEARERVNDPLEAVPDCPFGHLHAAWQKFLATTEPGDVIWSFSARWTTQWGSQECREGYVSVRGKAIGPHFLTIWKILESVEE